MTLEEKIVEIISRADNYMGADIGHDEATQEILNLIQSEIEKLKKKEKDFSEICVSGPESVLDFSQKGIKYDGYNQAINDILSLLKGKK